MNPDVREHKRNRRTALRLYSDGRSLAYISRALDLTVSEVYHLLEEDGVVEIRIEGTGVNDPLLEAPTMPKKQKTYAELVEENLNLRIQNVKLRNENLQLRQRLRCDASPSLAQS